VPRTANSPPWTDDLLQPKRKLGDPVADAPIGEVFQRGGIEAVNDVLRTLIHNNQPLPADLPDELETYLTTTLAMPEWADMDKIIRGQQLFETWGVVIFLCLTYASLPASYAAAKGVHVLRLTARLDTDARRRVMETGQFLMDVLSVGGLGEQGNGLRTIQHVRLMHAAIRHLIKARAEQDPELWNFQEWGQPLNQEDLAGTLLAFAYVVDLPMRRLGVRLSTKDIEAYLHLWNVIGHLLGVEDELLVYDLTDATALVAAIRRRQFGPSHAGREMTRALVALLDELVPGRIFDNVNPALIRHLITDEVADWLNVPPSSLVDDVGRFTRIVDWFFVHVLRRTERDCPLYHRMAGLRQTIGRVLVRELFEQQRGGVRAPFDIPDHLAHRWQLPPARQAAAG
jgi:hypothetical protein